MIKAGFVRGFRELDFSSVPRTMFLHSEILHVKVDGNLMLTVYVSVAGCFPIS